ncbi:MAG: T9SS type A sorting domain-containing protein [Candidatus Zixiibacteriota bacterium]
MWYRYEIEVTDWNGKHSDWSDTLVWAETGYLDYCPDPDPNPPYKTADSARQTTLSECYPNPFNAETVISFSVSVPGPVQLRIFNLLGQTVRTLDQGYAESGKHTVIWNGRDDVDNPVSSGVYFVRLEASDYSATKKIIMLK